MIDLKKWDLHEWSILIFFLIVPVLMIFIDCFFISSVSLINEIIFKWFIFSGVGLRLGSSGIMQIAKPQFTAKEIFGILDQKAADPIKELGFANVCFSIIAIISLFVPSFRVPASVAGGVYYGLAAFLHIFRKGKNSKEIFVMISDLYIFIILLVFLLLNLIN